MSLIASIKEYIAMYPGLVAGAGLLVETLNKTPTQYSLVPLPGTRVLESYLNGSELCQYPFALQSMESTADETARMATHEFFEDLSKWLKEQSEDGNLPALDDVKQTPESLEVINQAALIALGESGTGIYQLQCRLVYKQGV